MQFLHIWVFCMTEPMSTRMRVRYKRKACLSSVLSHPLLFSYHSCCLIHSSYPILSSSLLFSSLIHPIQSSVLFSAFHDERLDPMVRVRVIYLSESWSIFKSVFNIKSVSSQYSSQYSISSLVKVGQVNMVKSDSA